MPSIQLSRSNVTKGLLSHIPTKLHQCTCFFCADRHTDRHIDTWTLSKHTCRQLVQSKLKRKQINVRATKAVIEAREVNRLTEVPAVCDGTEKESVQQITTMLFRYTDTDQKDIYSCDIAALVIQIIDF